MGLSPDGRFAILFSDRGALKLWDLARDQEASALAGAATTNHGYVFSHDSKTLATWPRGAGTTNEAKLWDIVDTLVAIAILGLSVRRAATRASSAARRGIMAL